jgi:hypothetical protein
MVTLCPSEVPDAPQRLRACSERPRDVEDKIAGDGLAERFSLLAASSSAARIDGWRQARTALVLAEWRTYA